MDYRFPDGVLTVLIEDVPTTVHSEYTFWKTIIIRCRKKFFFFYLFRQNSSELYLTKSVLLSLVDELKFNRRISIETDFKTTLRESLR